MQETLRRDLETKERPPAEASPPRADGTVSAAVAASGVGVGVGVGVGGSRASSARPAPTSSVAARRGGDATGTKKKKKSKSKHHDKTKRHRQVTPKPPSSPPPEWSKGPPRTQPAAATAAKHAQQPAQAHQRQKGQKEQKQQQQQHQPQPRRPSHPQYLPQQLHQEELGNHGSPPPHQQQTPAKRQQQDLQQQPPEPRWMSTPPPSHQRKRTLGGVAPTAVPQVSPGHQQRLHPEAPERRESLVKGVTGKIDRMRQKMAALQVSTQLSRNAAHSKTGGGGGAGFGGGAAGVRGNQVAPMDYSDFLSETQRMAKRSSTVRAVPLYSKGFPIDPHHPFMTLWTGIMLCLILFECIVTPFGIGFLPLSSTPTALDITEAVFDVMFILDMGLAFCTAIRGYDGRLVKSFKVIAANYYARGFWLDLFTSLPFSLTIVLVELALGAGKAEHGLLVNVEVLAMIKVLRVLKIGKFMRVLRFNANAKRTQNACCGVAASSSNSKPSYARAYIAKQILVLVLGAFFTCHLIACGWGLLPKLVAEHAPRRWNIEMGLSGIDIWEEYCAAFYFAIVTLTSVGYGDVHPQNTAERIYLVLVIMVGALLYGYFIGNMTQLTVKHDANFLKISAKMDHVASYVKHRRFPEHIKRKVVMYYSELYQNSTALDEYAILMEMPEHLREESIGFLVKEHFFQLPFVTHMWRQRRTDFVIKLIASLKSLNFSPGQVVVEVGDRGSEMYIVISGEMHVVSAQDQFLCSLVVGDHFGEFAAFGVTRMRQATVVAGDYSTAYIITPQALSYAFSMYPDEFAEIRQEVRQRALDLHLDVECDSDWDSDLGDGLGGRVEAEAEAGKGNGGELEYARGQQGGGGADPAAAAAVAAAMAAVAPSTEDDDDDDDDDSDMYQAPATPEQPAAAGPAKGIIAAAGARSGSRTAAAPSSGGSGDGARLLGRSKSHAPRPVSMRAAQAQRSLSATNSPVGERKLHPQLHSQQSSFFPGYSNVRDSSRLVRQTQRDPITWSPLQARHHAKRPSADGGGPGGSGGGGGGGTTAASASATAAASPLVQRVHLHSDAAASGGAGAAAAVAGVREEQYEQPSPGTGGRRVQEVAAAATTEEEEEVVVVREDDGSGGDGGGGASWDSPSDFPQPQRSSSSRTATPLLPAAGTTRRAFRRTRPHTAGDANHHHHRHHVRDSDFESPDIRIVWRKLETLAQQMQLLHEEMRHLRSHR